VKGILPPNLGFIFDREARSDQEREDLEQHSGGRATLMKRRMYENYLLNPHAIAHVASTKPKASQRVTRYRPRKSRDGSRSTDGKRNTLTSKLMRMIATTFLGSPR
jgi:hypothetical protein